MTLRTITSQPNWLIQSGKDNDTICWMNSDWTSMPTMAGRLSLQLKKDVVYMLNLYLIILLLLHFYYTHWPCRLVSQFFAPLVFVLLWLRRCVDCSGFQHITRTWPTCHSPTARNFQSGCLRTLNTFQYITYLLLLPALD